MTMIDIDPATTMRAKRLEVMFWSAVRVIARHVTLSRLGGGGGHTIHNLDRRCSDPRATAAGWDQSERLRGRSD